MLGLIDVGGGMRDVYGCGVLDCFLEAGIRFDYCLGVSAGSANIASFLAEQKGRNLRFYTQHAQSPEYMGLGSFLKNGNYFNLKYVYETLTDHKDPIDYDAMLGSESQFVIAATDAKTGQAHYFEKSDIAKNHCRVLSASSALPVFCKPVEIGNRSFYDGGLADPIPIEKALADGCDRLVVILTQPRDYEKPPERGRFLYRTALRQHPEIASLLDARHENVAKGMAKLKEAEAAGIATIIAPTNTHGVRTTTRNPESLTLLYDQGRQDGAESVKALQDYSSKGKSACSSTSRT